MRAVHAAGQDQVAAVPRADAADVADAFATFRAVLAGHRAFARVTDPPMI